MPSRRVLTVPGAFPDEPIPVQVVRWVCPFCHRGRADRKAAAEHAARCWRNPAVRGCKTCALFEPGEAGDYETPSFPESCGAGIDLAGGLQTGCPQWTGTTEDTYGD